MKKSIAIILCLTTCLLTACGASTPQLCNEEIALRLTLQAIESKAIPMYYDNLSEKNSPLNYPDNYKEKFNEWDTYNANQISDFYNSILNSISASSDSK